MNFILALLLACAPVVSTPAIVLDRPDQTALLTGADFVIEAKNGIDAQIFDTYNAANGTNQISLYDGSYGSSVSLNQYKILVSVSDNHEVMAVRPYGSSASISIPSNGYVVAVNGTALPILSGYVVGDILTIKPVTDCQPRTAGVPVILFHDLGTTSTAFEAQLASIETAGYNTVTLADLQGFLDGSIGEYQSDPDPCDDTPRLPENPVLLTFDDAYISQFNFAPTLLDSYGMVGTFFIITSYPDSISWVASWDSISDAVTDYPDSVELACHSHNAHSQVTVAGKLVAKYLTMTETDQYNDMVSCADKLYEKTGVDPTAIAWPFGGYTEDLIDVAYDVGYDTTFNTWAGINAPENDDAEGHIRRFGSNAASSFSTVETTMNRWYVCY